MRWIRNRKQIMVGYERGEERIYSLSPIVFEVMLFFAVRVAGSEKYCKIISHTSRHKNRAGILF